MEKKIAYCGLDCNKCEAFIATKLNDNVMREKVAALWSEYNKVTIKKEDINCLGCFGDGVKTPYCECMCDIRICAVNKGFINCGQCDMLHVCEKINKIIGNNKEALENLK